MSRKKGPRFVPVEDVPGPGLSPRGRELVAVVIVGLCAYLLLALATYDAGRLDETAIERGVFRNVGGTVGYHIAGGLTFLLGWASWVLVLSGIVYGVVLFIGRPVERFVLKVLGVVVFAAMLALLFAGAHGDADPSRLAPYGAGGAFGANLSPKLYLAFGGSGRVLLLLFGAACAFLLATPWLLSNLVLRGGELIDALVQRMRAPRAQPLPAGGVADLEDEDEEADELPPRSLLQRLAEPFVLARRAIGAAVATADEEEVEEEEIDEPEEDEEVLELVFEDDEEVEEEIEGEEEVGEEEPEEEEEVEEPEPEPEPMVVHKPKPRKRRKRRKSLQRQQQGLPFDVPYPFPPIELFREAEGGDQALTEKTLDANKKAIERRLASFNVEARVVAASVGPAVTQYELQLGEGIKLSKITAYEADLAAALKAVSVRVVAPIPGKGTVGVEVPNRDRQMVVMRELLEEHGDADDMAIPLFLGKDVAGEPIVEDMAKMPHLLIAGTTGSGKSVCVNAILLSVLMTRTPRQVRLILIDPKMVELQIYKKVPHLACDVVTNMKKAPAVLNWAVEEMERRYTLLSAAGTNHIKTFNKLGQEEIEKRCQKPMDPFDCHLPYMVIVIDELADLMVNSKKEVEESIQRLAQKSRAVGLHVILATQRPSTDVITGVIKANLPCQIAFKVNRKIDSRVILDSNGAEKLLGYGDMLYVSPTKNQMLRAQGAFVSEDETHAVIDYLEKHAPDPTFVPSLLQTETAKKRGLKDRDDLYEDAVEVILGQQRGSATLIQRALSVGYTRATRLLEMMEEDGLVGPHLGSKSRAVQMTLEEWKEREAAMDEEMEALEEGEEFIDEDFEDDAEDEAGGEAGDDPDREASESASQ